MVKKIPKIIAFIFFELISAFVFTNSVIPGFNNIGHLFFQIVVTFLIIVFFLLIANPKRITPIIVSHSLIAMTAYWIYYAVSIQVKYHIRIGDRSLKWYHAFYYDRPALLVVVFGAAALFYTVKFIRNFNDDGFVAQYRKFQKTTSVSFLFYYIIILVYCFFLIREPGNNTEEINFVPFHVFQLMKDADYEYELIFLFVGNIAIFAPLGFISSAIFKGKLKIIIYFLPFILSVGIEALQFVFKTGYPDIDDVILNVIGYFAGYYISFALGKLVAKYSEGKYNSIFIS